MTRHAHIPTRGVLARALALACLLASAAGFGTSALRVREQPAPARATPARQHASAPRPAARALETLAAAGHWGTYRPRDVATATARATPRADGGVTLVRGVRLVGIETRAGERQALLRPAGAAAIGKPDAHGLVHVRAGDVLGADVSVAAIEDGAVRLHTGDGDITLHLYE